MQQLTPEAALLLAVAQPRPDATALARQLAQVSDWAGLTGLAQRHGLTPLLYNRWKESGNVMPPREVAGQWLQEAHHNAGFALLLCRELHRLLALLHEAGIPALPYKGPALAAWLYGDPVLRVYSDLDVLVRTEDLSRAQDLLGKEGWESPALAYTEAQQRLARDSYDAFSFQRKDILLELHWRIAERRFSFDLPVEELLGRAVEVNLTGRPVPMMAAEDALLVLCFHGAKHLWERLGWLCDVALLLDKCRDLDWEVVLSRASGLRCARVLALSLLLARDYLAAPLPADVNQRCEADPEARRLAAVAASYWFRRADFEPDKAARIRFHLEMCDNAPARWQYRVRLALRLKPEDITPLPFNLPSPPLFFYHPLRWKKLLATYLARSR